MINLTFQLLLAHFLSANKENSLNMSPNMNSGIQKFDILVIIFDNFFDFYTVVLGGHVWVIHIQNNKQKDVTLIIINSHFSGFLHKLCKN